METQEHIYNQSEKIDFLNQTPSLENALNSLGQNIDKHIDKEGKNMKEMLETAKIISEKSEVDEEFGNGIKNILDKYLVA